MVVIPKQKSGRVTAIALFVLLLLFVGRVAAQLWQYFWPTDALPPFSQWQSGALPYAVLVPAQLAIIAGSLWVILAIARGKLGRQRRTGTTLIVLGAVYFGFMVFRLVAGLTFLKDSPFFAAPLPTAFHYVLASMLIIVGAHLRRVET
jgi:hypothetical protein